MKQLLSLVFVLAALFVGGCDFLGEDSSGGETGDNSGGQDQGIVVVED